MYYWELSRKLTKNVYFFSQLQEIGHHELTTLSSISQFTTFGIRAFRSTSPLEKGKKKKKICQAPNNPFHQESNLSNSKHTTSNLLFISPCLKPQIVPDPAKKKTPYTSPHNPHPKYIYIYWKLSFCIKLKVNHV